MPARRQLHQLAHAGTGSLLFGDCCGKPSGIARNCRPARDDRATSRDFSSMRGTWREKATASPYHPARMTPAHVRCATVYFGAGRDPWALRHQAGGAMAIRPSSEQSNEQPDRSQRNLHALVARGQDRLDGARELLSRLLARHQHRPLIDIALRIYRRDRESAGTVLGSAVAFRLFLFFVPFLLFFVGLLGFAATWIEAEKVSEQAGVTGSLAGQIDAALSQPGSSRWVATILGLVGMAWAGRSLGKVLVSAGCLAWGLPVRTQTSIRIVGGVVGIVTGIGLVAVIVNRIRADLGLAAAGFSFVAVIAIYGLAWVVLSMLLPRSTTDPGALLPGAGLFGLTLATMHAISQLYLPDQFARASALYGAIGVTIVTLGWFFFLGRAMVLAMVVNAVVQERLGTVSQVLFSMPVLRALPRRSPWVRRFFDLDTEGPAGGDAEDN